MNDRLFSPTPISLPLSIPALLTADIIHTGKLFGLLRRDSPQMSQIALVSDQHYHDVGICMVSQLLQPPRNILVCLVLADIVDKQRPDGTSVICGCDGSVSFLACRIPNLCFDGLCVDLDRAGRKFNTDGRFGV